MNVFNYQGLNRPCTKIISHGFRVQLKLLLNEWHERCFHLSLLKLSLLHFHSMVCNNWISRKEAFATCILITNDSGIHIIENVLIRVSLRKKAHWLLVEEQNDLPPPRLSRCHCFIEILLFESNVVEETLPLTLAFKCCGTYE